jgi:predicted metal-dependent hydrolase
MHARAKQSALFAPAHAPEQIALPFDEPLPTPHSSQDKLRYIRLGQEVVAYHFKRGRRKSIGFMLDGEGLHVTAPQWVTLAEVESALTSKARWILAKRAEWSERQRRNPLPTISWQTGSSLPYLGGNIRLSLGTAMQAWLEQPLQADQLPTLHLPLTSQANTQQIRDRVHGWLQQQAKRIFAERLAIYSEKLGGQPLAWTLSSATTQWGSCTADGKIRLNWRLVHFPVNVIDYVIAHELAHLKEMNHGPQFWQTVAELFPNYPDAKQALKYVQPETLYEA